MNHTPVPLSAVFIYAEKSLGVFLALMTGIFIVLMVESTIANMKKKR